MTARGVTLTHDQSAMEAALDPDEDAILSQLRAAIQVGVEAVDRGEFLEFETMDALMAHLDEVADRVLQH
jgi:hypothetical protein